MKIGSTLLASEKTKIKNFLRENQDVFAWKHVDMLGIDEESSNIVSMLIRSASQCSRDEKYLRLNAIRQ